MVAPFPTDKVFIGGVWRPAGGDATLPIENPSTGEIMGALAAGTAADVDAAVRAARAAFEGDWGRMTAVERGRILARALADLDAPVLLVRKDQRRREPPFPYAAVLTLPFAAHQVVDSLSKLRVVAGSRPACPKAIGGSLTPA
jgi:hypothetical protein